MSPAAVDLNERQRAYLLAIFETDKELSGVVSTMSKT